MNGRTSWLFLRLEQEEKTSRLWKMVAQLGNQQKIYAVGYSGVYSGALHCEVCDLQMASGYSSNCHQCGLEDVCEDCMLTVNNTTMCLQCFLETEDECTLFNNVNDLKVRDKVIRGYAWASLCDLHDIISELGPPLHRNVLQLRRVLQEWHNCVKETLLFNLVVDGEVITAIKAFTGDVVASYRLVRLKGLTSRDPVQRLRSEVVAEIKKSLAHIGRIEVLMDRSLEDISKKDFSILAMPKTDHTTADRCNNVQRTRRHVNLPIPRRPLL